MPAKKTRKKVVNAKLSVCLDMAKLSDRNAALILTPVIQSLGHDPEEYTCSYSTIARQRLQHRKKIAAQLKEELKPEVPLTVHWDGKILEDLTGREKLIGFRFWYLGKVLTSFSVSRSWILGQGYR